MNNPRLVLSALNSVEIRKSRIIRPKLIAAIIAPIIVSQFLVDDGNFIDVRFRSVKVNL